jgi:hypothetical protein
MFLGTFDRELANQPGIAAGIFVVWFADVAWKISHWKFATRRKASLQICLGTAPFGFQGCGRANFIREVYREAGFYFFLFFPESSAPSSPKSHTK